jgi:lipid-A-disaccharide synthase
MARKKQFEIYTFEPPDEDVCDILIIAGEHSGDEQAARMLKTAYELNPDLRICAIGGKSLRMAGAQLLYDLTKFSVVGIVEVLKNYSNFKKLSEEVLKWIRKYKPKTVCFVDYPGFNLHIAKLLKKEGLSKKGGGDIELKYYISPQIWAWKAHRRFKMAELLDELAVIFPFEPQCYNDTTLKTTFVGHPFVSPDFVPRVRYDEHAPLLFLPGSRKIAVQKIFPIMLKTLRKLDGENVIVPFPSRQIHDTLKQILKKFPDLQDRVTLRKIGGGEKIGTKAVLMSSGTISLSACLEGIPGAIVYKANPLTYIIGRLLVSIKYLGISNIILDKPAWPEFIQGAAQPSKIAERLRKCINDKDTIVQTKTDAETLRNVLSAPSSTNAGEWLLS